MMYGWCARHASVPDRAQGHAEDRNHGENMKSLLKFSSALVGAIIIFGPGLYFAASNGAFDNLYLMITIIGLAAVTASWGVDVSTKFGQTASAFVLEWTTFFMTLAGVVSIVVFMRLIF